MHFLRDSGLQVFAPRHYAPAMSNKGLLPRCITLITYIHIRMQCLIRGSCLDAKPIFSPFMNISSVLESSQIGGSICTACCPKGEAQGCAECFTPRKLRFSALASCVALPPESIQSSGRYFLALTKKLLFLEVPYCHLGWRLSGGNCSGMFVAWPPVGTYKKGGGAKSSLMV